MKKIFNPPKFLKQLETSNSTQKTRVNFQEYIEAKNKKAGNGTAGSSVREPYSGISGVSVKDKNIISRIEKIQVAIDSKDRNRILYPNANDFNVFLGDSFTNVVRIKLVSSEIPNIEDTIRDLPLEIQNNLITWENEEDYPNAGIRTGVPLQFNPVTQTITFTSPAHNLVTGDTVYFSNSIIPDTTITLQGENVVVVVDSDTFTINFNSISDFIGTVDVDLGIPRYSISLTPGAYDSKTIATAIQEKLNTVLRSNGEPHYFVVTVNNNTNVFSFTSYTVIKLDSNPAVSVAGSSIVTLGQPYHGYQPGDSVYIAGLSQFGGIASTFLNGTFTVLTAELDSFTINSGTVANQSVNGGGSNVITGKTLKFRFLWDTENTKIQYNLGFPDEDSSEYLGKRSNGTVTDPLQTNAYRIVSIQPNVPTGFTTITVQDNKNGPTTLRPPTFLDISSISVNVNPVTITTRQTHSITKNFKAKVLNVDTTPQISEKYYTLKPISDTEYEIVDSDLFLGSVTSVSGLLQIDTDYISITNVLGVHQNTDIKNKSLPVFGVPASNKVIINGVISSLFLQDNPTLQTCQLTIKHPSHSFNGAVQLFDNGELPLFSGDHPALTTTNVKTTVPHTYSNIYKTDTFNIDYNTPVIVNCTSYTNMGNDYTLTLDNTIYTSINDTVTIDGFDYTINSFVPDLNVTAPYKNFAAITITITSATPLIPAPFTVTTKSSPSTAKFFYKNHSLATNDIVHIISTGPFNGDYLITTVTPDSFIIRHTYTIPLTMATVSTIGSDNKLQISETRYLAGEYNYYNKYQISDITGQVLFGQDTPKRWYTSQFLFPNVKWNSVSQSNDSKYRLAASNGYLTSSSDYGENWNIEVTGNFGITGISSDGTTFIAVESNTTLYRKDSSNVWAVLDTFTTIRDATISENGQYITVLQEDGGLFTSNNLGSDFYQRNLGMLVPSDYTYYSLEISFNAKYQVITGYHKPPNVHVLFQSSNYGISWQETVITEPAFPGSSGYLPAINSKCIDISQDGKYQTLVLTNLSASKIYSSSDYGVSFILATSYVTPYTSVRLDSSGKHQIAYIQSNTPEALAGSFQALPAFSSDYSATWYVPADGANEKWRNVSVSGNAKYIIGIRDYNDIYPNNANFLANNPVYDYWSSTGNVNLGKQDDWTQISLLPANLPFPLYDASFVRNCIATSEDGKYILIGGHAYEFWLNLSPPLPAPSGRMVLSNDYGQTWTNVTTPSVSIPNFPSVLTPPFKKVLMSSSGQIQFAITNNEWTPDFGIKLPNSVTCLISNDYGTNWQIVQDLSNLEQDYTNCIMSSDAKYITLINNETTKFYSSSDYGATFAEILTFNVSFPSITYLVSNSVSDNGQYHTVIGNTGVSGVILTNYNYGNPADWQASYPSIKVDPYTNISVSGNGKYQVYTDVSNVMVSNDFGGTFTSRYSGNNLYSSFVDRTGENMIVGTNAYLLFSKDYGVTWKDHSDDNTLFNVSKDWIQVNITRNGNMMCGVYRPDPFNDPAEIDNFWQWRIATDDNLTIFVQPSKSYYTDGDNITIENVPEINGGYTIFNNSANSFSITPSSLASTTTFSTGLVLNKSRLNIVESVTQSDNLNGTQAVITENDPTTTPPIQFETVVSSISYIATSKSPEDIKFDYYNRRSSEAVQPDPLPQNPILSTSLSQTGQYQTAVTSAAIYRSADYGSTWSETALADCISVSVSGGGRYQTVVTNGKDIYTSDDFGVTFNSVSGTSFNWREIAVSFDGKYQTAVAYNKEIYRSENYGITWDPVPSTTDYWKSVSVSSTGEYQSAVTSTEIFVSTDYGENWDSTGNTGTFTDIAISSTGQYQTAIGTSQQILVSNDYGATFFPRNPVGDFVCIAVSETGSRQVLTNTSSQVFVSQDYGDSWELSSKLIGNVIGISDDSKFITTGDSSFLYKSKVSPEPSTSDYRYILKLSLATQLSITPNEQLLITDLNNQISGKYLVYSTDFTSDSKVSNVYIQTNNVIDTNLFNLTVTPLFVQANTVRIVKYAHNLQATDTVYFSTNSEIPGVQTVLEVTSPNSFLVEYFHPNSIVTSQIFIQTNDTQVAVIGRNHNFTLYRLQSTSNNTAIDTPFISGIPIEYLQKEKTIDKITSTDTYTINTAQITANDTIDSGGPNVFITSSIHGFRDTQYNTLNGEDSTEIFRSIKLSGYNYIYLCLTGNNLQFSEIYNSSNVKNVFTKILLDQPPGHYCINSYISSDRVFYNPIPKLSNLHIQMVTPDNFLYNFKNIDYSLTLEISVAVEEIEQANLSSKSKKRLTYREIVQD